MPMEPPTATMVIWPALSWWWRPCSWAGSGAAGVRGMRHDTKTSDQWPVVSANDSVFLATDHWPLTTGVPVTFVIAGGAYGLLGVGVAPRIEGAVLCPELAHAREHKTSRPSRTGQAHRARGEASAERKGCRSAGRISGGVAGGSGKRYGAATGSRSVLIAESDPRRGAAAGGIV